MKTALILSALLVGLASNAYASSHSEKTYRDLIRPDGKPRSFAIYSAAVNGCYAQTHESRAALYDTPIVPSRFAVMAPAVIAFAGKGNFIAT